MDSAQTSARLANLERLTRVFWVVILAVLAFRAIQVSTNFEGDLIHYVETAKSTLGVAGWSIPWSYPPFAGVVVYPLNFLGLEGVREYFVVGVSGLSLGATALALWRYRVPYANLAMAYLVACAILAGLIFFYRLDSLTVPTTVLGILALSRGRDIQAGFWLMAGALVKSWPFVLAGAVGTVMGRWRVLATVAALAVSMTMAGLISGGEPWSWVTFASGREVQAESFAALPAAWGQYFGWDSHRLGYVWYGAYATAPYLGWVIIGLLATVGLGVLALTWVCRRQIFTPAPLPFWSPVHAAYLLVITGSLLVVSPVLSPQFLLWPCAVIVAALAFGWLGREAILSMFAILLTSLLYPGYYAEFMAGDDITPLVILTLRDALLMIMVVSAALRVMAARRPKPTISSELRSS